MPTGKFVNTDWKVVINNVDLSNHFFDIQIGDEKERIEVSGFSPTGNREYLPGLAEQSVTMQALADFGTAQVHQTVYPLYTGGSIFPFYVQVDSDEGTSTVNPLYGGSATVFNYPMGATLNERAEQTLEFRPASNSSFSWGTTAP